MSDATASLQGSAVTGKKYTTGKAFGAHSDFDIAVASESLFRKASRLGIELRRNPARIGPLTPEQVKALGLDKIERKLTRAANGRAVKFLLFKSDDKVLRWSSDTVRFNKAKKKTKGTKR